MNKRHVLLLTAVLGMASAPAHAQTAAPVAQATTVSADTQLSTAPITIETGTYGGPLSSLLAAISKAAGYGLILDADVDAGGAANAQAAAPAGTAPAGAVPATSNRPVVYSFKDKPFNQVWPLLMDVYGLSYNVVNVGGQPVLRVGNAPIQRIVALKNADVTEAVTQVKLFFGTPTYNEVQQKDAQGNIINTTHTLADVKIDSPTLRIVPDVRSNSVIVRGTNKEVAEVSRLLAQLDQNGATKDTGTAAAGSQTVQRVYTVQGQQADAVTLLTAQYPGLKITPVGQTGQLVVTGPQNQIEAALALLAQVDKPAAPKDTTTQKVFQLVNASAEELKATLEGTLARDLSKNVDLSAAQLVDPVTGQPYVGTLANSPMVQQMNQPATPAASAAPATTDNTVPVTIIADKRTNTLIVRGTPAQVEQVAALIPQLDKVVPQINVQVRIQEITEEATRSLGLDWKVNFGGFQVKAGSAGLGATFDPTRSLVGFNIFPTLNASETQGLSKKVYDGNITMQSGQRALNGGGYTANSSNAAAASVKSGGRLEITIPSSAANVAAISRQIDYGVNLDFFDPQVAPDGTITLRVRGQVNDLKTVIPTNGIGVPNILDFSNSEAQSIVTFKSGQTLLLAGLMGTNSSDTTNGLPYLSSVPVVGALVGNQGYKKKATQLLVVITGTVVQ